MKGGLFINTNLKKVQEWLPIEKIYDDGIFVSNHKFLKMVKIFPINYELKSELEKESILNSYKLFLKTCDFDLQLLIQSRKENLDSYISQMKKQSEHENDEKICQILNQYIDYIQSKNQIQNSSSKNFYILISSQFEKNEIEFNMKQIRNDLNDKYLKIKDTLSRCGNLIFDVDNRKDVEKILYSFYNFRKSLRLIER